MVGVDANSALVIGEVFIVYYWEIRMMTREEMEKCRSLRKEIHSIVDAIESVKTDTVVVSYKDYSSGKGVPKLSTEIVYEKEQKSFLENCLSEKKHALEKDLIEAEKFIEEIDDPEMCTIFRMYYLAGKTQQEIGDRINYSRESISLKINSFWKKQKKAES